MCRLFGLHAGRSPVTATFWLVGAPDSLAAQSRRNPDGAGIGVFDKDGAPVVDKQPLAAWNDPAFAEEAHELHGTTFVAHVRHASTGSNTVANTHPFLQDGRLFAHNGVVQGTDQLDAHLRELGAGALVHGDTDSERVFALVSAETARHEGDVGAGLRAALSWVSEHLGVYSLNLVLTTPHELWALRYPSTHSLFVLERAAGGTGGGGLDVTGSRLRARAEHLERRRSVVVASEAMDGEQGWRLLESGELVHVGADLSVTSELAFPEEPGHLLTISDLDPVAAASQHPDGPPAA